MDSVPFDLQPYRFIPYSTRYDQIDELKDELRRIAIGAIKGTISFGNPVTDFGAEPEGAERVLDEVRLSDEIGNAEESDEEEGEAGLLDFILEAQQSLQDITDRTERLTKKAQTYNQRITKRTEIMTSLADSTGFGTASRMHKEAAGSALDLEKYTEGIREELPGLHDSWTAFEQGFSAWYVSVKDESQVARDTVVNFRARMENFRNSVKKAIIGVQSSRDAAKGLGRLSRELNRASRKSVQAHEELIDELEIGVSVLDRVLGLIDQHLEACSS